MTWGWAGNRERLHGLRQLRRLRLRLRHWGQGVRPQLAWVHLQAMDFAGLLALCEPALPLVRDPEPGPAPDYPASYRFGLWKRCFRWAQTRAQECIAKRLSAMEGFEVPLAAWRVHATAARGSQGWQIPCPPKRRSDTYFCRRL